MFALRVCQGYYGEVKFDIEQGRYYKQKCPSHAHADVGLR